MTSRKKSGSSAASGKRKVSKRPKPPKSSLPDEDPKLAYVLSTSATAAGHIASLMDETADPAAKPIEPTAEPQKVNQGQKKRYLVGWGLGIIGLLFAIYLLLQYFFR